MMKRPALPQLLGPPLPPPQLLRSSSPPAAGRMFIPGRRGILVYFSFRESLAISPYDYRLLSITAFVSFFGQFGAKILAPNVSFVV